jgi:hypothetical protein
MFAFIRSCKSCKNTCICGCKSAKFTAVNLGKLINCHKTQVSTCKEQKGSFYPTSVSKKKFCNIDTGKIEKSDFFDE